MNIRFIKCTLAKYNELIKKDKNTLYFLEDAKKIFKGDSLYSDCIFVKDLPEVGKDEKLYITLDGKLNIWDSLNLKFIEINKFEKNLSDDTITNIPVDGESIKKYIDYKFQHAPIYVDANNIKYDNTKIGKTDLTNMQEVLDQVFIISDSIRKQIATTIGSGEENTFQQVADDLISYKRKLSELLRSKGLITVSSTQPLLTLINKVEDINNLNILKNTKLNVNAGDVKEINLKNKINLDQLCMSIIKYIPGNEGKEHYSCHFDNSDFINFESNNTIDFSDGTMKQKLKTKTIPCVKEQDLEKGSLYSATINKDDFYKIGDIKINEDDENNILNLDITGSFNPTTISPTNNIDLTHVYEITKLNWIANIGNNNKILAIVSFDNGSTYKSFYQNELITIDHTNLQEISEKGMNPSTLNSLTNIQWEQLRNSGNNMKFIYYFEVNDIMQKCENDDLTITVDMKGNNIIPETNDYSYKLSEDGLKIIITFNNPGTYTILWVDEKIEEI